MKRILVTGAGGYIGTVLVPMLLERGFAVRAVDRFFFGDDLLTEHPNLEIIKTDTRQLSAEHVKDVKAVIDLAAISNDPSGELFQTATLEINKEARIRCAKLAKAHGVERYILPSSCSIYGFQGADKLCAEKDQTNPLTTYALANEAAEQGVLPLADQNFTVAVLRQATIYGYSPRMRFDLAINGMTYGAFSNHKLPLMRDGSQWRPMVHVKDAAAAQLFFLQVPQDQINGQIFNVGSSANNYQIGHLAEIVANLVPGKVSIEWYGDPDHRSYRCSFEKIEKLGWNAQYSAKDGVLEIVDGLRSGRLERTDKTITLLWYQKLVEWQRILRGLEVDGRLIDFH